MFAALPSHHNCWYWSRSVRDGCCLLTPNCAVHQQSAMFHCWCTHQKWEAFGLHPHEELPTKLQYHCSFWLLAVDPETGQHIHLLVGEQSLVFTGASDIVQCLFSQSAHCQSDCVTIPGSIQLQRHAGPFHCTQVVHCGSMASEAKKRSSPGHLVGTLEAGC